MSDMPPILRELPGEFLGPRIRVRPYRAGDGRAVYEAVDESRNHLLPWLPWGEKHTSPEATEGMVRRWRSAWDLREDLAVGLWHRENGRYLGGSGLHRIRWEIPAFEIGYWIRASEEGKGYVTEAARLLCHLAFDHLDAARVFIRCAEGNDRSAAVPERLGFTLEGVLQNDTRDANGDLHATRIYGMVPANWKGGKQR